MDNGLSPLLVLGYGNVWLWLVLLVPIAYLLRLPLVLYFKVSHAADPTFLRVGDDLVLPEDVGQYLDSAREQLADLGFEEIGTFFGPDHTEDNNEVVRVLVNRDEQDVAIAISLSVRILLNSWMHSECVEFHAHYRDGSDIETVNSLEAVAPWPVPESVTTAAAPWLKECAELYRAHSAMCRAVAAGRPKEFELGSTYDGDVLAYLAANTTREFEQGVAAGHLRCARYEGPRESEAAEANPYQSPGSWQNSSRYVPTIKGACSAALDQIWPVQWWRRARVLRLARRRLSEAGVGSPTGWREYLCIVRKRYQQIERKKNSA